jgi:hypothetical protein
VTADATHVSHGTGIGGAPSGDEDPRADLTWGTIPNLVAQGSLRHPRNEAVIDGDIRLAYAELPEAVDLYARGFVAAGVDRADRVAIWAPNCAEWMLAALGALRAGAVLVPMNTRFKGGEAAYILRASGATTLLTVRGFLGVDYPALLDGEDTGALARIVLLRDEGKGAASPPHPTASVAGVETIGPGRDAPVRRHLGHHLHLGHHGPSQRSSDHARPVVAHVRHLGVDRRSFAHRSLPHRQPVLPHVRVQGRDLGLSHGRLHHRPRSRL